VTLLPLLSPLFFGAAGDPSALWNIVSTCVDTATPAYCECAAFARSCCGSTSTPNADVVWGVSPDFVAIRDMAMCGCGAGFVAGLALPRTRVSGIEDPKRPDAIWPFAWDVARRRIPDELDAALVINPVDARTQNQMHVHILRLQPDARARLDAHPDTMHLPTLDGVFTAAVGRVGDAAMGDHGILVTKRRAGGWLVVLTRGSSPQAFTQNRCR
jgi:CDP-diacylglycerol pyrophosphatase